MAKKFRLKSKKSSEATAKATAKKGGRSFKFKKDKTKLLILPPVEEDASVFSTVFTHTLWGSKGALANCSSPFANGEDDKIHTLGWKVKDKYGKHKNQKVKDFFRNLLVTEKNAINVLDLDDLDAGPQTLQMPNGISAVVMQEFKDVENDDFTDICDLDEGRILQITTNGKQGTKQVRYDVVKFLKKTAQLKADDKLSDDEEAEIIENMPDLTKLQPKFDEDEFENFLKKVMKEGEKLGIDFDELDSEDDDDEEESDDEYESEDDDDEFEENDDEEDEEDDDDEEEDDDEEDEDEEEEEEPVKKKKPAKKNSKKKAGKKKRR